MILGRNKDRLTVVAALRNMLDDAGNVAGEAALSHGNCVWKL